MLKEQIVSQLIRADGKLNVSILRREWFQQSELNQHILANTFFLPPDSTYKKRVFCILNDIQQEPKCPICEQPCFFSDSFEKSYSDTCSNRKCIAEYTKNDRLNTCYNKYGAAVSPKARKKTKERAKEFVKKSKLTLKQRYGVNNPGEIEGHALRAISTKKQRYGDVFTPEYKMSIKVRRNKTYQDMSNDVTVSSVAKRVQDTRQLFDVKFTCNTCATQETLFGETFKWRATNNYNPCSKCSGIKYGSALEHEVLEFLQQIVPQEIRQHDRTILTNNRELDIFIPKFNIAFEINGLFWHSYCTLETPDQRNYHLNKTKDCDAKGIRLFHIMEHDWCLRKDIVQSRIRNVVGATTKLFARNLVVREVEDKQLVKTFLQTNHLQGNVGHTKAVGLFNGDELVSIMTFGAPRYADFEFELLRFCSKLNYTVVGGASKLFKFFIKYFNPKSIISYGNIMWSPSVEGAVYGKIGMEWIRSSAPNYYYFKSQDGLKLHSRVSFQKHKLAEKLDAFDPTLSEAENMFNNGYRRIWDCGNQVWVWNNENLQPSL